MWNRNSTLALLSLYETNMHMLENPKKKTKMWIAISEGLRDLNIEMSSDQVRWKMNALQKKYKECIDNNSKSGRGTMTFEFYNEMEDIFGQQRESNALYTNSSSLPSKKKSSPIIEIHSLKQEKIKDLTNEMSNATTSIKSEISKKRFRPGHGTGSNKSRVKFELEKQWLQHLQTAQSRQIDHVERCEKLLNAKTEALQLQKRQLQMHEKQLEIKKTIAANKLKAKERRHEEIIEMERLKCKLLSKLINDKENINKDSDSE